MLIDKEFKLKNITLRNRIVMPPMAREGSADGKATENLIELPLESRMYWTYNN